VSRRLKGIVLCKNEADSQGPCLEAVLGQEGAGASSVTVIDSGSTDGSVELARSLPVLLTRIAPNEFHHARPVVRRWLATPPN
jgi:hypothetical protein